MNTESKWGQTMLKKYKTEEGIREEMKRRQLNSRQNYSGNGGFRSMDATRHKEISSKGGKASVERRRKSA